MIPQLSMMNGNEAIRFGNSPHLDRAIANNGFVRAGCRDAAPLIPNVLRKKATAITSAEMKMMLSSGNRGLN